MYYKVNTLFCCFTGVFVELTHELNLKPPGPSQAGEHNMPLSVSVCVHVCSCVCGKTDVSQHNHYFHLPILAPVVDALGRDSEMTIGDSQAMTFGIIH